MSFDPLPLGPSSNDDLVRWLNGQTIPIQRITDLDALTDKATPVDADEVWIADSEDDGASKKVSLDNLPAHNAGTLTIKTDTGDPASPTEGQIYVNTFDNKIRVYADAAWRDLATW